MGQEIECTARFRRQVSHGKAKLEPDSLSFKGGFRLSIPLKEAKSVEARRGKLRVTFGGEAAIFDLGRLAETWALKIRYPKSLIDKLGVKAGSKTTVVGIEDENFWNQLKERTSDVSLRLRKEADNLFFGAETVAALSKLERLHEYIRRNGAIWVVAPKGVARIREADVLSAAKTAGLVDTKVVSFSETHTAHKLVIPVANR